MNQKNFSAIGKTLSFKKFIMAALLITIVCFLGTGCGRRDANKLIKSKQTAIQGQTLQGGSSTVQNDSLQNNTENKAASKSVVPNTNTSINASSSKLDEASTLMDSLNDTLNGTDNSSDINDAESIINNIN